MKKWYTGATVVLFALSLTTALSWGDDPPFSNREGEHQNPVFSGGPIGPPGFGPNPIFHPGLERQLNLSREQLDKIEELRDFSHSDTRSLRYELAQKHLEFRRLFSDPKVDEATLLAKQKEIDVLNEKLQNEAADTLLKIRKILSPEQISRLDQIPPPPFPHWMGKSRGRMGEPCHRGDWGPGWDDDDMLFEPHPE